MSCKSHLDVLRRISIVYDQMGYSERVREIEGGPCVALDTSWKEKENYEHVMQDTNGIRTHQQPPLLAD